MLLFSDRIITGSLRSPLFDINGLTVGQKSLELGAPEQRSSKYVIMERRLSLVVRFPCLRYASQLAGVFHLLNLLRSIAFLYAAFRRFELEGTSLTFYTFLFYWSMLI